MNIILTFYLIFNLGPQESFFILLLPTVFVLIPFVFYLLSLQKTLKVISVENRKMHPWQVWLVLIPFFGFIWNFFIVSGIADSLKAEFNDKNIEVEEERPGYKIGLAYSIILCFTIIPLFGIGYVALIAGVTCMIIYWIKINGYRKKLALV